MAENRDAEERTGNNPPRSMLEHYQPSIDETRSSILRPAMRANQFEIKPAIIQMIQNTVQFGGAATDDPNAHIANFLEIRDIFKHNVVSDDAIRLRLFSFSLRDRAKSWLTSLPAGSITTWEDMAKAFLVKYFPPSKTMKMRTDITNFAQYDQESLYEAWERYKDLLRKCPHHELPDWLVVQTFYNCLFTANRSMIDAAAGGNLMRKTSEEGYELLEEMAASSYNAHADRHAPRKQTGVHQVDSFTSLAAQLEVI